VTTGTEKGHRTRPSLEQRVMNFAGGDEWRGTDVPPAARTLYYSGGKEVPRETEDAEVIASLNDGFELWFGTPNKWHHHMRAEDVRLLFKYLVWDWYVKARWLGLRRPIYYWALHRHVDRFKRLRRSTEADRA
jgi:hypothetical protein